MDKSKLRKILTYERKALSGTEVKDNSDKIIKKLVSYITWRDIRTINAFQTIRSNNEIDVGSLLDYIRQNYPNIRIDMTENKISAVQNMTEGKNYDLVLIPLLGFDRSGNRLGYGGGYYDRFLANNQCKQSVGLAYSLQEVDMIPAEKHDKKLDMIITEKEVIKT